MGCPETAPLALLRQGPVQDTEPDQVFEDLTLLASQICGTPMALMAVLDESRRSLEVWVGIEAAAAARDIAFRAHPIQPDGLFVVADTLETTASGSIRWCLENRGSVSVPGRHSSHAMATPSALSASSTASGGR